MPAHISSPAPKQGRVSRLVPCEPASSGCASGADWRGRSSTHTPSGIPMHISCSSAGTLWSR